MWHAKDSPVEARDRGLQRLRGWTTAGALLAAALAFVFALLAAGTFPGRDTSASSGDSSSSSGASVQPQEEQPTVAQPQPPSNGYFGSGSGSGSGFGGTRHARSGGS